MSNLLKKITNIKIVSIIIAGILAVAVLLGIVCNALGWGVFNKDAVMKDSKTLTVSVSTFHFNENLDTLEEECEKVLGKYGILYEMKGEMSGDACEVVYVFDKDTDLDSAKTELETKFAALTAERGDLEGANLLVAVNSEKAVGTLASGYVWRAVVASVVIAVLVFAYLAIRFGWAMGLTAGVATLLGAMLTTALIVITRIPVTASVIYVIAVGALLTAGTSVIAIHKIVEKDGEVQPATDEIGALGILMTAAVVVMGAIATNGVRWFAILAVLAIVAAAFIGLVFVPAMYLPFKVAADNKPVEGAYVGAVKTSTKEKKVFPKQEKAAKVDSPKAAPVQETAEPVAEEVEEVEEISAEEEPATEEVAEEEKQD